MGDLSDAPWYVGSTTNPDPYSARRALVAVRGRGRVGCHSFDVCSVTAVVEAAGTRRGKSLFSHLVIFFHLLVRVVLALFFYVLGRVERRFVL